MLNLTEIPVSPATRKTYISALGNLDKWLRGREVNDETLAAYMSYLFDRKRSTSVAEAVLKAVRWRCLSQDTPDPRGKLCFRAITRFRREAAEEERGRGQADPLLYEDVDKLVALAVGENTIYGDRAASLFSLMSDGLLRIGEAAAVNVTHLDFNANTLFIPRSKTDQTGRGDHQFIRDRTLELAHAWLKRSRIESGPLFRPINETYNRIRKTGINKDSILRIIKKRAKAAGIEGRITGHSFRIGAAQSLTARGATLVELQIAGRWQSADMVAHYAKKVAVSQSCVARIRGADR